MKLFKIALILFASQAQAQSLRQKAVLENQTAITKPAEKSSTPQIESILRLEDPYQLKDTSPFSWTIGVATEPFTPKGIAVVADAFQYDLASTGTTLIPLIRGGLTYENPNTPNVRWQAFVAAGVTSQKLQLLSPSAIVIDARLMSAVIKAELVSSYRFPELPAFSLGLKAEAGQLQMVQTSNNAFARWSQSQLFGGLGPQAAYEIFKSTLLNVSYSLRTPAQSEESAALASSLEMGVTYQW